MEHELMMLKEELISEPALTGCTPQARKAQKEHIAFTWLARWGWSTPAILQELLGVANQKFLSNWLDKGMVVKSVVPEGKQLAKGPRTIIRLTAAGSTSLRLGTPCRPIKSVRAIVKWDSLPHDFIIQQATVRAICDGLIEDYRSPAELSGQSLKCVKEPDVVWVIDGKPVAVEYERTSKETRRLHEIVDNYVRALTTEEAPYFAVSFFTFDKTIHQAYHRILGCSAPGYYRSQNGYEVWVDLPDEVLRRIDLCLLKK